MTLSIKKLFDLAGRIAIVTGGAGFLGRQHAAALCEAGAKVVLWDISQAALTQAQQELERLFPGQVFACEVDIVNPESVRKGTLEIENTHGGLDILVNNAGMTVAQGTEKFKHYFDPFESYPVELWNLALEVNLTGTFIVTQALVPFLFKSNNAAVINIASDVGVISPDHRIYQPNPERDYSGVQFNSPLSYATSKAALIQMTRFWATYWAKKGIRVNSISPAGVENYQNPQFMRELIERIPLGRMAKPHELKGAIVFLASDASSYITGINLMVDGGRTVW
jgi:NAD(P)-dependent dehydrogenase (short-subunit alcohol dehydrogenase family)